MQGLIFNYLFLEFAALEIWEFSLVLHFLILFLTFKDKYSVVHATSKYLISIY